MKDSGRSGETLPILEVRNLTICFEQYARGLQRQSLRPVSGFCCRARQGELTAIVGASGSGKSLVAHGILGLLPYNCRMEGEIFYLGKPLTQKELLRLRGNEIALIPQGVSYLDPLMRVGEQIRGGKRDGASREKCRALLARYGLDAATEGLYPFELSGGMARRALIAAALMGEPRLIIADEPTPGLDERTARRVVGHLRELAREGAAVLLITHDLELAVELADRICVFYEGKIVEETSPEAFRKGEGLSHPYSWALCRAMPQNGFWAPGRGWEMG